MKHIKLLKKFDIFIIISLLIISFTPLIFFKVSSSNTSSKKFVTVKVNGVLKEQFNINEDKTFNISTPHGNNKVSILDGIVSMSDADCTDKLCVNSKPISNIYQSIICLPHSLIIEIEGENEKSSDDMIFSH
ncbi:MAG: NusG domain II-containing protein [Clostridium sp.]|uniref:NusG domain II-containing protein n=1 Tax=Clostridium sp. TaxID=1506 RepID=UPI003F2C1C08